MKDTRERYESTCCNCGKVFYACKSIMQMSGYLDSGHGSCTGCGKFLNLTFNEDKNIMETMLWQDYLDKKIVKIRCSKCNKEMEDGYEVHDGLYHYCSDECLYSEIGEEEYKELHEEGFAFWTTFE